jgi:acetoin utilization deacetylase AcuC-like enzyme
MADMEPDQRKEECLTKFHSVYMNEKSYECAELAAGSAIELTKAILDGEIQNGLALLRPPGNRSDVIRIPKFESLTILSIL